MKRSLAVPLYLLMVFLSGVLVGSFGYRLYSAKALAASAAPKPKPEEWRRHMIEEMRTRFKLSDDQVAKLQAAFDESRQRFLAYDQQAKAERKAIMEDQHRKIREFLSDQQRGEYDKFLEERQKRRLEEKKNHPAN